MSPGGEFISCIMLLQFIPVQEGYTALHFAALKQHADVVQCLLEGNSPCPDILAQVLSFPSINFIFIAMHPLMYISPNAGQRDATHVCSCQWE